MLLCISKVTDVIADEIEEGIGIINQISDDKLNINVNNENVGEE